MNEAVARARALCNELGLSGLAALLETEPVGRSARALVLGPVSSGKTSTILSLIGQPALLDGLPILPVGVQPLTAQLTMVEPGSDNLEIIASRDDGSSVRESDASCIRNVLLDGTAPFRLSRLTLPGAPRLAGWTWIDAPGLGGADDEGASAELVTLGLALADVVLLHIRAHTGLGRARPVLDLLAGASLAHVDLLPRVIPVLTDVRSIERVEEISAQLRAEFGDLQEPVLVGRRGEIDPLVARLSEWRDAGGIARTTASRTDRVLREVVLPALRRVVRAEPDAELVTEIEHLEASVSRAWEAGRQIHELTASHRDLLSSELAKLVTTAEADAREQVRAFADVADRSAPRGSLRAVSQIVDHRLHSEFQEQSEVAINGRIIELQKRTEEVLQSLQVEVVAPMISRAAPLFSNSLGYAGRQGGHTGVQAALGALAARLGGRSGSVVLATQNAARMVAARAMKAATGRKLTQEAVRRTIPKAVKKLGEGLKFIGKNQALVALALEVAAALWTAARLRANVRSAGEEMIAGWRDGITPSVLERTKAALGFATIEPSPSVSALLDEVVRDIWEGQDGLAAQAAAWESLLQETSRPWQEELTGLRRARDRHGELDRRVREIEVQTKEGSAT